MNEATQQSLGEQALKKDMQYELLCPTCKRVTKQARLEGDEYWCTICCERHTIYVGTRESFKAAVRTMAQGQRVAEKLGI